MEAEKTGGREGGDAEMRKGKKIQAELQYRLGWIDGENCNTGWDG